MKVRHQPADHTYTRTYSISSSKRVFPICVSQCMFVYVLYTEGTVISISVAAVWLIHYSYSPPLPVFMFLSLHPPSSCSLSVTHTFSPSPSFTFILDCGNKKRKKYQAFFSPEMEQITKNRYRWLKTCPVMEKVGKATRGKGPDEKERESERQRGSCVD